MFRRTMVWLACVTTAAMLAVMLLSVGGAVAKTPGWQFRDVFNGKIVNPKVAADATHEKAFTGSPPTVAPNANVAFNVEIDNIGSSNISALYLSTDIDPKNPLGNPVYIFDAVWTGQDGPSRPCDPFADAPLSCSFGALNAGASVSVEIVFKAPASGTFSFNFLASGNGDTPSDSGGTSHGDALKGPASVSISTDPDFGGGFSLDGAPVSNVDDLGPKNIQAGSVTPPHSLVGVSLEDGLSDTAFSCTEPKCSHRFGEWTRLYVAGGDHFSNGFQFSMTVLASKVPSGATVDNIVLIHVRDDGTTETISTRCSSLTLPTVPGVQCLTVTKPSNQVFQIDAWLTDNGGLHSAY